MSLTAIQPASADNVAAGQDLEAIQSLVADDIEAVDACILAQLHSEVTLVNQVAHHIINSGGKRLRPLIVVLGARACSYAGREHIDLATIVEFIHTATLLHDDVVDASTLRRGQATANALFGNEASVLVGDFVYSRAFQLMVQVGSMRVMDLMADTTNTIAEGEVLQLLNCGDPRTSEEQYLRVIRSKTAKLFEAAAQVGGVLAHAPQEHEAALAAFGRHLGTAYQLIDDVLDYRGTVDEIGKNIGDDLAEGKPTLPLIYVMRNGNEEQAETVRNAIQHGGRDDIERVVSAVESTGAISYTSAAAQAEARAAANALDALAPSSYRTALQDLAHFCAARTY
ncbi:MAG: octaprenyl diphosphate synthase [Gammaproteobacteria bacterium]